jgi:hypothetical protein
LRRDGKKRRAGATRTPLLGALVPGRGDARATRATSLTGSRCIHLPRHATLVPSLPSIRLRRPRLRSMVPRSPLWSTRKEGASAAMREMGPSSRLQASSPQALLPPLHLLPGSHGGEAPSPSASESWHGPAAARGTFTV